MTNIGQILASLTAEERKALDNDIRLHGNSFILVTEAGAVRLPPEAVPMIKLSEEERKAVHKKWEDYARGFNGGGRPALLLGPLEAKGNIHQEHVPGGPLPNACVNCGASLPNNSPCPGDWPE